MIRQQIIFGIVILLYLIYMFRRLRERYISIKYALLWLPLGFIMLLLDLFPKILWSVTGKLGLEIPANLVFSVGILFLLLQVFLLSTELSKQDEKIRRLAQEQALLRKEISKNKDK